jgi:hypothetical protein
VTEAVFGLIGVVVGGVLTGAVAYVLERRRETREARIARRIMRAQFGQALKAVDDGLKGKNWPPGWDDKRWSDSWVAHRQALAAKMDDDDFATLAHGALYMELLQVGFKKDARPFGPRDKGFFEEVRSFVQDADQVLPRDKGDTRRLGSQHDR